MFGIISKIVSVFLEIVYIKVILASFFRFDRYSKVLGMLIINKVNVRGESFNGNIIIILLKIVGLVILVVFVLVIVGCVGCVVCVCCKYRSWRVRNNL